MTASEAQKRLIAGNSRFVAGDTQHPHELAAWRGRLASAQHPFATFVGCSDSRVPPELLFDQGFGDLFVIRVAGNVVDPDVTGSIEYAVDHLATPLVVVMGHEGCGAVTAALGALRKIEQEPAEIQSLLRKIQPALERLDRSVPKREMINRGVELNVQQSVRQLMTIPDLKKAVDNGRVNVVGAIYEFESGKVRFLEDSDTKKNSQTSP